MTRYLEIVFYGMACFDSVGDNYRVLLPDGRDPSPFNMAPHVASVWIRPRKAKPLYRWSWPHEDNDFVIGARTTLAISGLKYTKPLKTKFDKRLSNLRKSDANYTLSTNPKAIMRTMVDRGRLSAQLFKSGMIVTVWHVAVEKSANVRFTFGKNFIEIGPRTQQVVLANIGTRLPKSGEDSHFNLYRKLATVPIGYLSAHAPDVTPDDATVVIQDPSDKYHPLTPLRDCSGAFAQ